MPEYSLANHSADAGGGVGSAAKSAPSPMRRNALNKPQLAGPLYFQIQQLLRARILAGEWVNDQPLPNETDLARSYGVSVGTMRKALELLTQAKLIVRRQGLGTFVHERRNVPTSRFRRWIGDRGPVAECDHLVLDKGFAQPSAAEAIRLRLPDRVPVARVSVRTSVAGRPAILDRYVISITLAPGLDDYMIDNGPDFADLLQSLEAGFTRCEDRISAVAAPPDVADCLGLGAATPVLRIDRLALAREDRPLLLCCRHAVTASAHYEVETE